MIEGHPTQRQELPGMITTVWAIVVDLGRMKQTDQLELVCSWEPLAD
jgi:hypothetical protein